MSGNRPCRIQLRLGDSLNVKAPDRCPGQWGFESLSPSQKLKCRSGGIGRHGSRVGFAKDFWVVTIRHSCGFESRLRYPIHGIVKRNSVKRSAEGMTDIRASAMLVPWGEIPRSCQFFERGGESAMGPPMGAGRPRRSLVPHAWRFGAAESPATSQGGGKPSSR